MLTKPDRRQRSAFTLIELIVVIGLIVILLALGALFLPGLQGNQKVQNGVDRLAQWLLIAKQRAKHDGLPTGLRFVVTNNPTADPAPPNSQPYLTASQFIYVQQPDPLTGDVATGAAPTAGKTAFTSSDPLAAGKVLFTGSVDFIGPDSGNPLVMAGDYLELFGGGALYPIAQADTTTIKVGMTTQTFPSLKLVQRFSGDTGPSLPTATGNWRVIRQPRRVVGEDVLTLPQDIVVDLTVMPLPVPPAPVPNPPTSWVQGWSRNLPAPRAGNIEIMFSPAGDVTASVAASGKIMLWVRDSTVPSPVQGDVTPMQGNPTLVSIQVRTGLIGTYPVTPNTTAARYPLQFYDAAQQGRSGF